MINALLLILPSTLSFLIVRLCSSSQYVVPIASISLPNLSAATDTPPSDDISLNALSAFFISSSRSSLSSVSSEFAELSSLSSSTRLQYHATNDERYNIPLPSGSTCLICLSISSPWKPSPSSSHSVSNSDKGKVPVLSESNSSNTFAALRPATVSRFSGSLADVGGDVDGFFVCIFSDAFGSVLALAGVSSFVVAVNKGFTIDDGTVDVLLLPKLDPPNAPNGDCVEDVALTLPKPVVDFDDADAANAPNPPLPSSACVLLAPKPNPVVAAVLPKPKPNPPEPEAEPDVVLSPVAVVNGEVLPNVTPEDVDVDGDENVNADGAAARSPKVLVGVDVLPNTGVADEEVEAKPNGERELDAALVLSFNVSELDSDLDLSLPNGLGAAADIGGYAPDEAGFDTVAFV